MKRTVAIMVVLLATAVAVAQGGSDDCPGFRNPTTFVTNNPQYYWVGRVGERVCTSDQNDTTTGYRIMSTAQFCSDIPADSLLEYKYYSRLEWDGAIHTCGHYFFDASDRRFQIITGANAGLDQFTVYNGYGMQRICPGYTTSIRLGDMCSTGNAQQVGDIVPSIYSPDLPGNRSSEALIYTMYVTPFNALLIINYAVVARRYDHEAYDAGEFLIRVVKQDTNGTWPNEPINDSLWYKVSAPHHTGVVTPPWVMGLQSGSWPCVYVYKPWARVAISLSDFLYENVRVEMYTSDCLYNADPLYAYICGDYQTMTLFPSGCPDPESDVLDTLTAPEGMLSYEWYVSTSGPVQSIYNPDEIANTHFRLVQASSTDNHYTPRLDDFRLTEGSSAGDTTVTQTFRCVMTSALDPAKPMHSRVYVNLKNRRPIMRCRWTNECTGAVTFINDSYTGLVNGMDDEATYWVVYADTLHTMPLDTLWGDTASYTFPRDGHYGVKLYCSTAADNDGDACGATKKFVCRASAKPPVGFRVAGDVHCDSDRVVFVCTAGCDMAKRWTIDDSVMCSTVGEPLSVVGMELAKGRHVVTLTTINEDGCESTTSDTVTVYGIPEVNIGGDRSVICLGDTVTVTASGNGTDYNWSSSPEDTALASQQGRDTLVLTPSQTTVYYLSPSSSNPCSGESSMFTITVLPSPKAVIRTSLPSVSIDASNVSFSDATLNRKTTLWRFSDGVQDSGQTVYHSFSVYGEDSVGVWMESCNRAGCCGDTSLWLPVEQVGVWFPNVFIPGEGGRFGMITALDIKGYEIYIYNREGLLVHRSEDAAMQWDGTDLNGRPCQQGAYVYWYRYATNDLGDWHEGHGTVTLLR